MTTFEKEVNQRVTLSLSRKSDKNGLSECHVLNDALNVYEHWLQKNQAEGIGDTEYNNLVYAILANIRYELTVELLKQPNEPTDEEGQTAQ